MQVAWDLDVRLSRCGARLPSWLEDQLPSWLGTRLMRAFTRTHPLEISLGLVDEAGAGGNGGGAGEAEGASSALQTIGKAVGTRLRLARSRRGSSSCSSGGGGGRAGSGAQARDADGGGEIGATLRQVEALAQELARQQQAAAALQESASEAHGRAQRLVVELRSLLTLKDEQISCLQKQVDELNIRTASLSRGIAEKSMPPQDNREHQQQQALW